MKLKKLCLLFLLTFSSFLGCNGCVATTTRIRPIATITTTERYLDRTSNVEHIMNSVVALVHNNDEGRRTVFCTAFFINESYIATAGHCLSQNTEIIPGMTIREPPVTDARVEFITYSQWASNQSIILQTPHVATVVGYDSEHDVGLLKITAPVSGVQFLEMNLVDLRVGEKTIVLGHPLGIPWYLSEGMVSQLYRDSDGTLDRIGSNSNIFYGSSGGPLLNSRGQVIGVVSYMRGPQSYLGFHVPVKRVQDLLFPLLHPTPTTH